MTRRSASGVTACMSEISRAPPPRAGAPLAPQRGAGPQQEGRREGERRPEQFSTTSHTIAGRFEASRASGRCAERLPQPATQRVQCPRSSPNIPGRFSTWILSWSARANGRTRRSRAWTEQFGRAVRSQRTRDERRSCSETLFRENFCGYDQRTEWRKKKRQLISPTPRTSLVACSVRVFA